MKQKISQAELVGKLGISFEQVQKYEKGINCVDGWHGSMKLEGRRKTTEDRRFRLRRAES